MRHDDNVLQITGIELDYDGENIAFDDMLKLVEEMGISALTYTSPSHTSAAQRWRILAPISQRLQPEMRAKLVARLDGYLKAKLGAKTIAASESFALSQAYYYGWVMNKPGLDHRVEVLIGDFIDLRDDLATFEANGGRAANDATNKAAAGKSQDEQDHQAHGFDAILGELGDGDGLNGFNGPLTRAAASYVKVYFENLDKEKLKTILRDAIGKAPKKNTRDPQSIKRYTGDKYLDDIIKSAIKKYTDELPVTLDHFVADMETHSYIYLPTRKPWPSPSVNARIRPVAILDAAGRPVLDSKKKPKKNAGQRMAGQEPSHRGGDVGARRTDDDQGSVGGVGGIV